MAILDSRRTRHVVPIALFIAVLPALLLAGKPAFAINSGCRTDPAIILSDGTVLDISATIGTNLTRVQRVTYTLHAPQGTTLLAAISTPNWPTTTESFQFFADSPPGVYTTDTVVSTTDNNVYVEATTAFGLEIQSVAGRDRQHLRITVSR